MTVPGHQPAEADALADLRRVQARFGGGALVLVQSGTPAARADLLDELAADLTAAAISAAHAAAAYRRADR